MGGYVLLNRPAVMLISCKAFVGSDGLWKSCSFPIWRARKNTFCNLGLNCQEKERVAETLNSMQAAQVELYVDLLLDWNKRMNLTAVKDRDAVMERHIRDSLSLLPVMEAANSKRIQQSQKGEINLIDVGSGAGLPGLICAIARPAWQVTLLESLKKRCNFLDYVVQKMGLPNVQVVHARAEEKGHDTRFREVYDFAVARAVAEMRVLELCLPFVSIGGVFVAAKGTSPEEEVEAAKKVINLLGASDVSISIVDSAGPFGPRTAVVCVKDRLTPLKYPRLAGVPAKHPL